MVPDRWGNQEGDSSGEPILITLSLTFTYLVKMQPPKEKHHSNGLAGPSTAPWMKGTENVLAWRTVNKEHPGSENKHSSQPNPKILKWEKAFDWQMKV